MNQPTAYRELLQTILEALDVPNPAGDWDARDRVQARRVDIVVSDLRVHLRSVRDPDRLRTDEQLAADSIAWIRGIVAEYPVDYPVREDET